MTTALILLGGLVGLGLIVSAIGYTLPVAHTATRERSYSASVDRLFAAVANVGEYPRWRRGVKSVEVLPPQAGKDRFRETGSNGVLTYVLDERVVPQRIVSRIAATGLPFGGRWTYDFSPDPAGSRLRITEDGEVYNPLFRFMARYVFGHERTMTEYLDDLERYMAASQDRAQSH
jgi:Polyketide cyclase / dehydrase and lipid transport